MDIFGDCTGNRPCSGRGDVVCESNAHFQYRFYMAFESCLCKDYITERFGKVLAGDGNFFIFCLRQHLHIVMSQVDDSNWRSVMMATVVRLRSGNEKIEYLANFSQSN